jgi:hypothetical protein
MGLVRHGNGMQPTTTSSAWVKVLDVYSLALKLTALIMKAP